MDINGDRATLPFSQEDEDALLHLRIISDEKGLRKLVKKFHTYVSFAIGPLDPCHQKTEEIEACSEEEARESLLAEIATFQLSLQKNALICQAEARQVLEYEREKVKIVQEQEVTAQQIVKLKVTLEAEQMLRKRKIEYDQVAEKVNLLPTRAELQAEIDSIQEEILAVQEENDHKSRMMHARKTALDQIVSSLEALRQLDQEPEIQIIDEPALDGVSGDAAGDEDMCSREDLEDRDDDRRDRAREREARDREEENNESDEILPSTGTLNPAAKPFLPRDVLERLRDGEQGSPAPSLPPSAASSPTPLKPEEGEEGEEHEDIEMGEVQEQSPEPSALSGRPEQKELEELEEGEASDGEDPHASAPSN